jgi:hypothetical protein
MGYHQGLNDCQHCRATLSEAPGLRSVSSVNSGLVETTHGRDFWKLLEQWWWSSNSSSGYRVGTGESLLGTVRKLYEISPLPPEFDPLNSKLGRDNGPLSPNYCSELQVVDLAGDEKQHTQDSDKRFPGGNPGEHERFSRPWLSKKNNGNEPRGTDVSGEPGETESVVDSYDKQWKSIIGILYLTNL